MAAGPRRLGLAAISVVAAAIVFVVAVAFASGGDIATILYVTPIVLLGAVVIAIAVKTRAGSVRPRGCERCGGLVSPNAPYCKHCGAPL